MKAEPRAIGSGHRIVFSFNTTVTSAGTATATDANGVSIGPVTATLAPDASEVIVPLPAIADASRLTVTLSNVNNSGGGTIALGFLVGDVSSDRLVSSGDISAVKSQSAQATTAANFKFDLNASGSVSAADIAAVKARLNLQLP